MSLHRRLGLRLLAIGSAIALLASSPQSAAQQGQTGRIESLLKDGWEIAGFISAWENRSLILFRHKTHAYLVQCSVLIDVTRMPRQVIACYDLK